MIVERKSFIVDILIYKILLCKFCDIHFKFHQNLNELVLIIINSMIEF